MMKIYEANRRGYKHKNLIFWLAMINSLSRPLEKTDVVLDFGCGSGLFLQLLFECNPFGRGYGIDLDSSAITSAKTTLENKDNYPITYHQASLEDVLDAQEKILFDVIFIQEVLWMNKDIQLISNTLFKLLKEGGRCYCAIGCHAENPVWEHRKNRITAEGHQTYTHSLDEIANTFSKSGFAVGLRRLPIDGFLMYHPETTVLNAGSFSSLAASTYEHKMLLYFGKTKQIAKPENIHD